MLILNLLKRALKSEFKRLAFLHVLVLINRHQEILWTLQKSWTRGSHRKDFLLYQFQVIKFRGKMAVCPTGQVRKDSLEILPRHT